MKETTFFIKQLQDKGLKITPQRQEIIRVF
ncbi:hypothetical protein N752_09685 [Desulforamulus aquiferis]|nr:hypothetical protein N752_09685 [Desulforamulus aquiferis]